jgi:hypothetical protein
MFKYLFYALVGIFGIAGIICVMKFSGNEPEVIVQNVDTGRWANVMIDYGYFPMFSKECGVAVLSTEILKNDIFTILENCRLAVNGELVVKEIQPSGYCTMRYSVEGLDERRISDVIEFFMRDNENLSSILRKVDKETFLEYKNKVTEDLIMSGWTNAEDVMSGITKGDVHKFLAKLASCPPRRTFTENNCCFIGNKRQFMR